MRSARTAPRGRRGRSRRTALALGGALLACQGCALALTGPVRPDTAPEPEPDVMPLVPMAHLAVLPPQLSGPQRHVRLADRYVDVPAVVLHASPGTPVPVASAAGVGDIPFAAMAAYHNAAAVMDIAAPDCALSWTLLAAVGRVESDHGRHAGSVLGMDGVSRPSIVGVALDGTGAVARVPDTDDGRYDGDRAWDRAVGPMQFLPSTWAVVGVDADGDGIRSPDDIDDAALAAAVYLCAASSDLEGPTGMRRALFAYNPSTSYVATVLAQEEAYRAGVYTVAGHWTTAELVESDSPDDHGADQPRGRLDASRPSGHPGGRPNDSRGSRHAGGSTHGSGPTPGDEDASPPPAEETAVPPDPEPSDPGTDPTPPADTYDGGEASTPPDPQPTPSPPPGPVTVSGTWMACRASFCLDTTPVDAGADDVLALQAAADYDANGVTGSAREELIGLEGRTVDLLVDQTAAAWTVLAINGLPYGTVPGEAAEPTAPAESPSAG